MSVRRVRSQLVALVVELVAVATLAGFGPAFPRDVGAGTAWAFLGRHGLELAHAGLGAVVLVQAVALVVAERTAWSSWAVAAGSALAVAAGVGFVTAGQSDGALTAMTLGWLLALGGAVAGLVRLRRLRGPGLGR